MRSALAAAYMGLLVAVAAPAVGRAELWQDFYKVRRLKAPESQNNATVNKHKDVTCLEAIVQAQDRHEIPDNLLLAIGIQEAGRSLGGKIEIWPWTVNADGAGFFFRTEEDAINKVRSLRQKGVTSIDVGCMQINQKWHPHAFRDLKEAFDPMANVEYAARYLLELHERYGDWTRAAASYHSSTKKYQEIYLRKLVKNKVVANLISGEIRSKIGERQNQEEIRSSKVQEIPMPPVLWSSHKAATGQKRFSIYSRRALNPALPDYVAEE